MLYPPPGTRSPQNCSRSSDVMRGHCSVHAASVVTVYVFFSGMGQPSTATQLTLVVFYTEKITSPLLQIGLSLPLPCRQPRHPEAEKEKEPGARFRHIALDKHVAEAPEGTHKNRPGSLRSTDVTWYLTQIR